MDDALIKQAIKNSSIRDELFEKYEVKRGLRNKDGSGVVAGLTNIGTAIGFQKVENDVIPMPGQLIYRNYSVLDLVRGYSARKGRRYEEAGYLLLFGKLPTSSELDSFSRELTSQRNLPVNFKDDMICKLTGSDVMNMLARSILILYATDENPDDTSPENIVRQSVSIIAKFPIITAYSFQAIKHGCSVATFRWPKEDMGTAESFLYLLKGSNYNELEVEMLDLLLMLHAEHGGGNNSTFTARCVSSTGTDTYSAIAAAIGSLKGPLHGGASSKARAMMNEIKKAVTDWSLQKKISEYLSLIVEKRAFDKSGKIYGLGHSVYTLSDPRRIVLKEKARELAIQKGREKEMALYELVEEIGPEIIHSQKGGQKIISANVDFYSGFIYDCLGLPEELYTALFAMGRILGWSAHRLEEMVSGKRLMRPSYKSVSALEKYVPINERS